MRVAVTGAAGFVGTNLIDALLARGDEVIAVDRVRPWAHDHPAVTWVAGDVLDPASMTAALEGAEVVFHLVALITLRHTDDIAWRVNTEGVRVVAESALAVGVRRMVHCSSIHAYDQYRLPGELSEKSARSADPGLPVYDRSKWAGELELRRVVDRGLDAVICNPTAVYGPVDHGMSRINAVLRNAARGRTPVLTGGRFDFVDVRDVADGLIRAAERGDAGENYLLSGHMHAMIDIARMAAHAARRRGPLFGVPLGALAAIMPIAEPLGALFGSDSVSRAAIGALRAAPVVDGSRARDDLGHNARPTDETVRDLVSFFATSGLLQHSRAMVPTKP